FLVALALAFTTAAVATADRTSADPTRGPTARPLPHRSRSLGLPFRGHLRDGVWLRESAHVRYVTEYAAAGNHYGTWELVQLLERAAYRVARRIPGAKLSVGELSKERGGTIAGHNSHENGRDVDVAFYMLRGKKPAETFSFVNFNANGTSRAPSQGLEFDDARNWELVQKLVTDGDARVQYIFVAKTLKQRLLREGERRGASSAILTRAKEVLVQPASGHPHRNHFHVRIYCSPSDRPKCRDRAPFHAWYPGSPPGADRRTAALRSPLRDSL
ncbi:MAG: penicillin-insensitive murein endopeptidase, partial [Myxococcales bacterium]|nr:penicillin-insensitive murein endopeptidase [Myxococcales bacterium]